MIDALLPVHTRCSHCSAVWALTMLVVSSSVPLNAKKDFTRKKKRLTLRLVRNHLMPMLVLRELLNGSLLVNSVVHHGLNLHGSVDILCLGVISDVVSQIA